MNKIDYKEIEEFINSILIILEHKLDKDAIDNVSHYLKNAEYEMAFEGLFIEIMKLNPLPEINISKSEKIGKLLKLDEDSVFDYYFWDKFKNFIATKAS